MNYHTPRFRIKPVRSAMLVALGLMVAGQALAQEAQPNQAPDGKAADQQIERISVSGRLLSSAAAVAEERREQPTVVELLGMEQISRAGDSNAAAALRRVTGLTLVKDKFIYVRGLGERYSSTLLNGAMVPSPDPTRNVVPMDMFPAGIIESMVVQKAYSPELPAAFGGGNVNIRTVSIPNNQTFSFSFGASRNSLDSDKGLDYANVSDNWRGKDDGSRGLTDTFQTAVDTYGSLDPVKIAQKLGGVNAANLAKAELINRNLGLELNRQLDVTEQNTAPDFNSSMSYGNKFDIGQRVFGVMAGVSYDKSEQNSHDQERYYSISSGTELTPLNRYDDILRTEQQVKLSGMLNFGFEWNENHRIETSTIYLADTKDRIKRKIGDSIETINEANKENEIYNLLYEERSMVSNQVRGRHTLEFLNDLQLNWQYTDAKARRYAPNEVEYLYVRTLNDAGALQSKTLRRSDNAAIYQFGDMQDNTENGSWDIKYPFEAIGASWTLSSGYSYFERQRDASTGRYKMDTRGYSNTELTQDYSVIFSDANIKDANKGFQLSDVTGQADDYKAAQIIDAVYANIDGNLTDSWRVNLGARFEDFRQASLPMNPSTGAIEGNVKEMTLSDTGVYPALSVTYLQTDETQWRFGASKTTVRPDLREVTPVLFIDPITDFKVMGYSSLKSTDITGTDLRLERYLESGSNYSFGLFYKDMQNPIEAIELKGSDGNLLMSFRNALSGRVYGVEAEALQKLDFADGEVGQVLDNFFVNANLTLSKSDIEMPALGESNLTHTKRALTGHSKYVVNVQLGFDSDNEKHSATLTYNVFGKRIAFAGIDGKDDAFEQPFHSLDFTYSYDVFEQGAVKFSLKNLLDENTEILQQGEILQGREQGQTVGLSFSQKF